MQPATGADITLEGLLDAVASSDPTPGGGSVSALAGALGAALSAMVFRLTETKGYGPLAAEGALAGLIADLEQARGDLLEAYAADADSYEQVLAAFRLPKETEEERAERSRAVQAAMRHATEVPLHTARLCARVLGLCRTALADGYDQAVTDAGVGAALAHVGVIGALYNVQINLSSVRDEGFVAATIEQVAELRADAERLRREADAAVLAALSL